MNSYRWRGIDAAGLTHKGLMSAWSEQEVKDALFKQNIALLSIHKRKRQIIADFAERFAPLQTSLGFFFTYLSLLLKSGLPLVEALNLVSAQIPLRSLTFITVQIAQQVRKGFSLGDALMNYPQTFKPYMVHLVRIGERVGSLAQTLEMVGNQIKEKEELERKIKAAAFIPLMTLTFASALMIGIFVVIIPQFETFFGSSERPLPPSTIIVLKISRLLQSDTVLIGGLVSLFIVLILNLYIRQNNYLTLMKDTLIVHTRYIGSFITLLEVGRYIKVLALMVKAGVPLHEALPAAQSVINNRYLSKRLGTIANQIRQGQSLSTGLRSIGSPFIPNQLIAHITMGEQMGNLGDMLDKSSTIMTQELQRKLQFFTSVLQPVLLIVVGLIVAFLMVAVYMPIFDMVTLVG